MSIIKDILGKIFHRPDAQPGPAAGQATPGTSTTPGSTATASTTPPSSGTSPATTAASSTAPVDVEAVLSRMPNSQSLNWRSSIVDLMKLLGMDSSLGARKQLAQELHYSGDMNDSAAMNQWLHKQVMKQLAANGGKLPAELHA